MTRKRTVVRRTKKPAPTTGTSITSCTFKQLGVEHTEYTVRAIEAIARAATVNAEALKALAGVVNGEAVKFTEPMLKIGA